jgi:hypothetical protein
MSVGEDPRHGRLSTPTNDDHVERFRAVILGNLRLTVGEASDEVGFSIGSSHQIFTEKRQLHRVSAKFVPRLLNDDQKENLVEISQELPQPPYSPNLAPADFFLFPKLKTTLKGRRVPTRQTINTTATRELRVITTMRPMRDSDNGRNVGNGVSPVEGTNLKWTVLTML